MTSILSIVLIGFIQTGSLGFSHDPLVDGINLRLGAKQGIRGCLMISFGSGENQVDSIETVYSPSSYVTNTIYNYSYFRPYSWVNLGVRAEYYFKDQEWFQPYIGLGFEGKKESRWNTEWRGDDTTSRTVPVKAEANYWGPTAAAGLNFYPISFIGKVFNLDISFARALSFNVEICGYYLMTHKFQGTELSSGWFGYYQERKFSGIGSGVGIYYNW
jgi:hypothetical protein